MGTDDHDQLEDHGSTEKLVAESTEQQATGIGVVRDVRELKLDLADDVAGEDGDQTEGDGEENTGEHAEGVVGGGQAQGTEGNGLDDGDDGQTLPAQAVEVGVTLGGDGLDAVSVHLLARLAKDGVVGGAIHGGRLVGAGGALDVGLAGRLLVLEGGKTHRNTSRDRRGKGREASSPLSEGKRKSALRVHGSVLGGKGPACR